MAPGVCCCKYICTARQGPGLKVLNKVSCPSCLGVCGAEGSDAFYKGYKPNSGG